MSLKTIMQSKFNPTLSFDGVAIIGGILVGAAAWGSLKSRVEQQEKIISEHSVILREMSINQGQTSQNLAVLQQLVKDRLSALQHQ